MRETYIKLFGVPCLMPTSANTIMGHLSAKIDKPDTGYSLSRSVMCMVPKYSISQLFDHMQTVMQYLIFKE